MVRERIKEVVEFATSQSPYQNANKGWVTDDVYLQLGSSPDQSSAQGDQLANISVYWRPVSQLISIVFLVFLLATAFVLGAVSLSKGEIDFSSITEVSRSSQATLSEDLPSGSAPVSQSSGLVEEAILGDDVGRATASQPLRDLLEPSTEQLAPSPNRLNPEPELSDDLLEQRKKELSSPLNMLQVNRS